MADQLFPVPFHGDTLVLVAHGDEPFVAMKPVVENMGLAWQTQHRKMLEKFGATITIMVTVGEDGKNREMVCLPLRKLPAWLYSINPRKVAPELREKIVRYQEECDEILWRYWTQGYVARPGVNQPTIAQQLAAHGVRLRLLERLRGEADPAMRRAIHDQLGHASRLLGLTCPALEAIGRDEAPPHESPLLAEFWEVWDSLAATRPTLNHARHPGLIALSLPELAEAARQAQLGLPDMPALRQVLKHCRSPRFVGVKAVNSLHRGHTVKCWVFESPAAEGEV